MKIRSIIKTFSLCCYTSIIFNSDVWYASFEFISLQILYIFKYFQEAVAQGFELEMGRMDHPDSYLNSISEELITKRDFMAKFLTDVGMTPTVPEGGYFMIADWSALGKFQWNVCHFLNITKTMSMRN